MVYGAIHASATNADPSDQTNPPAASHPEAPEQSNLSSFFRPTQRSPPTAPGHFGKFFFRGFPKKCAKSLQVTNVVQQVVHLLLCLEMHRVGGGGVELEKVKNDF